MPTARELLEQADALMRRNRLAPPAADEGIPTLTDAVPAPPAAALEPPSARAIVRAEAANDLEDVPLLTDAVEEIEAPSILEEPPEADDPDAWTDTLTGAHTIIPAVPIELPAARGGQTDATQGGIGVLPEEWGATPAPHAGPSFAIETIDIPAPPADLTEHVPAAPDAEASSFGTLPPAGIPRDFPPPPPAEALPLPDAGAPEDILAAGGEPDARPRVAPEADETQPATPFEWPTFGGEPVAEAATVPEAAAVMPAQPADVPSEPAATASPVATADDDARWSALAEEVRMQVLQRIDLFTDTGLREQLAARLQPIVDRASADLVATINQHVGVLLRAYVAEAIEREIERWRADRS